MFPSQKTQKNYVFKISELMLLYCFNQKKRKDFIDLINNHCDIYRKTDLYNVKKKKFFPKKKKNLEQNNVKTKRSNKTKKKRFLKTFN